MFFTKGARLAKLIYDFGNSEEVEEKLVIPQYDSSAKYLSFSNIELKYFGHHLLAPPFDLQIKKHEVLGIIGPSGCGRSTLLEFLAGLRPLIIEGKNTLLSTSLTSYVEQKPYIFEGSIADNLRFGCNQNVSTEEEHAPAPSNQSNISCEMAV